MQYARLAVNLPAVAGEFDYAIPDSLLGQVGVGHLVTAPFAHQTVQGVVLELVAEPSVPHPKPLLELLDPLPVLTPPQIALARWMAEHFLAPLAAMIGLMLPAGLSQQADTEYALRYTNLAPLEETGQVGKRLLALLQERGPLRARQIDRHFKHVDWRKIAQALVRRGVLTSRSVLPPPGVRPRLVRTVQLAVSPAEAEAALPTLGRTQTTLARRQAALRFLMRTAEPVNVSWVYAESGCNLADLQELQERGLVILGEGEFWRDPLEALSAPKETTTPLALTPDQQAAWEQLLPALRGRPGDFLLHGVTGSGKTELYLRAVDEVLRQGRQALILVPEIALTPQTVRRFIGRFPGQVGLFHSRLSEGERYDTWRRARLGLLRVVIGPRSALFAPLPKIGLIVVDECHDPSYYQAEPPFYHAVTAARHYAHLCGAVCLLGSATPTIVQQYEARQALPVSSALGERRLIRLVLPERVEGRSLPSVQVVDMRQELKSGNRSIFSRALRQALAEVLERGEQAILFLNRRGQATYVFCRECGYVARCPRCDVPLTLHLERGEESAPEQEVLTCHHCNYRRKMPKTCPACGSHVIRAYGLGSEKVEAEVQALFPGARTLRWDWETTRRKNAHEVILAHFAAHRADVLIGTQMLAKGLDLPLVTLVGIVLAEVGLNLPDPFANERTFSLLTQVAGRAGRSERGGRVLLQTFQPEHYVLQSAAQHDVDGFYARELAERQRLGYPPFARLLRLEYRHLDPAKAEAEAHRLAEKLRGLIASSGARQTSLIGPAPCFFARLEGLYRWQIVLRGTHPELLVRSLRLEGWRIEVDPISLL